MQNRVSTNQDSQLASEIKSDAEIMRALSAHPRLLRDILRAGYISEEHTKLREAYLAGTHEGFAVLFGFIVGMEVPVSASGVCETDAIGNYILPHTDPSTGEALFHRFAKWLYVQAFDSESTIQDDWNNEKLLPLSSERVN